MASITTRAGKGSPLTNNEVDANFTNLNTDKAETDGATLTNVDINSGTIDGVTIGGASAGAGSFTTINSSSNCTFDGVVTVDRVINATTSADPWLKGVNGSGTETSFIKPDGGAFFAGNLSVDNSAIFNESGADVDFRVESDSNANALFVDASAGSGAGVIHFGGEIAANYAETGGNGQLAYLIDNGSNYGSLVLSNNADRGWSMIYANKFAYTSGDDRRYIAWYVNGSSLAALQLNAAGTQVEYNTGSDRRLKENIVDIDDGIVRLKQMQPRKYTWVGTDFPAEGFIADEADGIVPEAVKGEVGAVDPQGNPIYQQIEYSRYVPLLTAALQEAIAKIESLEARVAQLEAN